MARVRAGRGVIVRVKAVVAVDVHIDPEEYRVNAELGGEPLWDVGLAICRYFDAPPGDASEEFPYKLVSHELDFEEVDGEPLQNLFEEEEEEEDE